MPGQALEVVARDGRIEIEAVSQPMVLVQRGGFLAAETGDDGSDPLTAEQVRDVLESTRR